ncbi:MAG: hypothetical protein ACYTGJ_07575 [Planctomycetota bacterium]
MTEAREPRRTPRSPEPPRRSGGEPGSDGPSRTRDTGSGGAILSSLQIGTPLEEFRSHYRKKQRSFEGMAVARPAEIYRRAFELAEELIRKQRGGDDEC